MCAFPWIHDPVFLPVLALTVSLTVKAGMDRGYRPSSTFFASVLKRTPFACTMVMVKCPVLLTFRSRAMPLLPLCVPATTMQWSPSFSCGVFVVGTVTWFAAQNNAER